MKNGKKRPLKNGKYPVYGGNGIMDYIDSYNAENTIIVGRVGAYCGCIYKCEDRCWVSDNAISVIAKEMADTQFLYYLMTTLDFHHHHIGGAQPLMTQDIIGNFDVSIPPLSLQQQIVTILKSIDDKIEINKRINDNLEQQAQALFKSWFVDFEPFKDGEFVESELGRIPKGWRVGTLTDVAELRKPSIRPQDKIFYTHYSIPAFDNSKKPSADEGSTIKSNKIGISDGAVLLSKLNPSTKRIWYTGIVPNNSVSSTEFLPFYSKNQKFTPFLYCYLNYNRNYNEIANGAKGTTNSHQRIDANSILNRNLAISEEAIDEFCDCCQSFMNLILAANQESRRLAQIRDLLLPKLMSGELKINDVEKNL